jgi:hypothetical protein
LTKVYQLEGGSMKKLCLAVIVFSLMIAGCAGLTETMFAHNRLTPVVINQIAHKNVITNVGLAKGYFKYNEVSELNYYLAKILDISVVDEELYADIYNSVMVHLKSCNDKIVKRYCDEFRPLIPSLTTKYRNAYYELAQMLGQARQKEINAMANIMSSWGESASKIGQQMQYNIKIPEVSFKLESENQVDHYLVNTSSGLRQCRVTSKGYVFCF